MSEEQTSKPSDEPGNEPAISQPSPLWLRRADQGGVALLVALGLLGTVAWWYFHGGPRGELIEWERLETHRAEFQVDINQADWPELTQLPGVGEMRARRIVESRRRDGPFRNCEDLQRVQGIGPKTVERLRPYLVF